MFRQNLQLFAFVDAEFIDLAIVFGTDEIKSPVVSERSPLRVDQDVLLAVGRAIIKLSVLDPFHVACVTSGSCYN